jgi:predicted unusual protein kinase regulating ubiquinone biosynthesis (AarF/ABC1/UbiB family)
MSVVAVAPSPLPAAALRRRYRRVMAFFVPAALQIILWDMILPRLGLRPLARRTRRRRFRNLARRFRTLASELGGVWIKVGQFLSARVDVMPVEITAELADLQDEVAPEPLQSMLGVIEAEFGRPASDVFAGFEAAPLASASLGQVHRARLKTGEAVVIKVQRPAIESLIEVDLNALRRVIGWLKRYRAITRRVDLDSLLEQFSSTLWGEVDYLAEAANAARFAEMFADDATVRIPAVYQATSTRRVLTLEDVYFIKITDYAAIKSSGVQLNEVADRLFGTYLTQIFERGFFHADPHPGNLFVEALGDGKWRLVFVDFGMVGHLPEDVMQGLRELAIAVGTRDAERAITAYQMLGVLLPGVDLDRLRQAEEAVFDRLWGKSMRELVRIHPREMHQVVGQFRDLLYEMPFQLPSDLILLGRCVAILSGMCTGLNPGFNVFEGLAPYARSLLSEDGEDWLDMALKWLTEQGSALAAMPGRMDRVLSKVEGGQLIVRAQAGPDLELRLRALTRAINRLVAAVVFAALLLVGALMLDGGHDALGLASLIASLIPLLWLVRG